MEKFEALNLPLLSWLKWLSSKIRYGTSSINPLSFSLLEPLSTFSSNLSLLNLEWNLESGGSEKKIFYSSAF